MDLKHSPRRGAPAAGLAALPYRGPTGARRPAALEGLSLPPAAMPAFRRGRPLKAWRYVAFFAPDLIACAARVRIGPLRDSFWAVWDRRHRLWWSGRRAVGLDDTTATIATRRLALELAFTPVPGVETVCRSGALYGWTAKQAPLPAVAMLRTGTAARRCEGLVLVDDTAAYYERHTRWYWSAGVGRDAAGAVVAWNLVSGVNDPACSSERTLWIDGIPREAPPVSFAQDLSAVGELRFSAEATLARRTRLGPLRSDYRQPIGTFAGALPGGIEIFDALGVMERHDAWW